MPDYRGGVSASKGFGHLLGARLVGLRSSEHDNKKGEQKRDEIRVGYQPPFMIYVSLTSSFPGHYQPSAETGCAAGWALAPAFALPLAV